MRSKQLMAEGIGGAPNAFLTLTLRTNNHQNPDQAALTLSRAWRLLRLRMIRHMKWKKLPFLAVFERHKSGWPHLHIMCRMGFIDVKWISAQMADIADSPVVHITRIYNPAKVAAYVAKYCSKDAHKFGTAKRYWQSQDFDTRPDPDEKPKAAPGEGWENERVTLAKWITIFQELDWTVTRVSRWKATARRPP